ncbi:MAG: hypothetical protein IT210_18050 [Armatimonadetes bacterium]|nr:hypothetical protein [Armatimonadota bacterium]
MPNLLQCIRIDENRAVIRLHNRTKRTVRVGDRCDDWDLVAILPEPEAMAVLERPFNRRQTILYLPTQGPALIIDKPFGDTPEPRRAALSFPPEHFETILASREDILARQVLESGEEPSYEAVAGLLAPLHSYTFLGTPESQDKIILMPDGRLGHFDPIQGNNKDLSWVLFDPWAIIAAGRDTSAVQQKLWEGYLPVVSAQFVLPESGGVWEQTAFVWGDTLHVSLRSPEGRQRYWQVLSTPTEEDGSAFYKALLPLCRYWGEFFSGGIQVSLPQEREEKASRACIMRALITGSGQHPHYGVGSYAHPMHDAFPPTTLSLVSCLLEWGFFEEASARLSYYLSRLVREDGTFEYYGPAVTEYGQMLALAARKTQLTRERGWLVEYFPVLERIASRLLAERAENRARSEPEAPHYGLLYGVAEADTREEQDFYFSGDIWCWRGLVEMGRILIQCDVEAGTGRKWLDEAESYRQDILAALIRAFRPDADPPFLPPAVGLARPFERMTESEYSSYTNYRYWLEMLSAGLLSEEMTDAVSDYRATRGGEMLGTTRFLGHLDDWPYAHYAWGLLSRGRIRRYLLGFYAHLTHHLTPGTLTAYEQVPIAGCPARDYIADYCVPAQLVTPMLLRWMLAWEEWDADTLHLARAAPARWFHTSFSASGIPTRWGAVSFSIMRLDGGLKAEIAMDRFHPKLTILLHLRSLEEQDSCEVAVKGANEWELREGVLYLRDIGRKAEARIYPSGKEIEHERPA